jgi:hypothetical protein
MIQRPASPRQALTYKTESTELTIFTLSRQVNHYFFLLNKLTLAYFEPLYPQYIKHSLHTPTYKMSESTFHTTIQDLRKPESHVSHAHGGKTPKDSNISAMKVG